MISESKLKSLLFFDIETCGAYKNYESFQANDPSGAEIWKKKCNRLGYGTPSNGYDEKVALFPEFGQIVCLSYGIWQSDGRMQVNTIQGEEPEMMKFIANLFHKASANGLVPTGWNIKNFDVPWVVRKLLMNGVQVPQSIATYDKKPWEVNILDMKEMWKTFSSLDVTFEEAAYSLGIPTPKDDIDGSQVHDEFWKGNLNRIVTYCEKDVKTMILMMEQIYKIYNKN
jgi:3'-5' exonuclease